jgi:hypothetical protein
MAACEEMELALLFDCPVSLDRLGSSLVLKINGAEGVGAFSRYSFVSLASCAAGPWMINVEGFWCWSK